MSRITQKFGKVILQYFIYNRILTMSTVIDCFKPMKGFYFFRSSFSDQTWCLQAFGKVAAHFSSGDVCRGLWSASAFIGSCLHKNGKHSNIHVQCTYIRAA